MTEAPRAAARRTVLGAVEAPGAGAHGFRQSRRVLRRGPRARLALGDLHGHHDGDGIPRPDVRADRQRARTRRARDFERLGRGCCRCRFSTSRKSSVSRPAHASGGATACIRNATAILCRNAWMQCTGAEILEEVLRQLRFDQKLDAIMASSICIPCDMPYVNNIWLPRRRADRPRPVPEGSTNLGLIGQYVEVPRDMAFTIEYSARTAWEAIHLLLKRGPRAAARLSGPVRSESAVRRAEGVCLSGGYPTESYLMCWRRRKWIWDGSNRWPCVPNEP